MGAERNNMSDTTETQTVGPDPSTILCRVVDVNNAIHNSFQKFIEAESKTLEDLASLIRDELGQMELFAPQTTDTPESTSV